MTGRDEWFTLERAARHLGVSSRTLRRWIKSGKLDAELQPGGYLEINFLSHPHGETNNALASVSATLSSAFSEQYTFTHDRDLKRHLRQNWILVAGTGPQMSDTQLFATIASANDVRRNYRALAAHYIPSGPSRDGGKVLTDQYAPIEEMMR